MKKRLLLLLSVVATTLGASGPAWTLESAAQVRVGVDTNPVAAGGATAPLFGTDNSGFASGGMTFSLARAAGAGGTAKFSYAAESFRYADRTEENYSTHRLGFSASRTAGAWKLSADGNTLWIDGSKDTLASNSAGNANATALWRERRAQWQHRLKLLAQHEAGARVVRLSGALLDFDYHTHVVTGRTAFANRRDANIGADLGWKQSPRALWLAGVRAGLQEQEQVALAGGQIDYSSRYWRVLVGGEGKLGSATTVSVLAGPDFRHYNGAVDTRVFTDRDRTSLWLEAAVTSKVGKQLALTGKVARWVWLASTGKSAYTDLSFDTGATWTVNDTTSLRATCKVAQSDYNPVVRDDWQAFYGLGVTLKSTANLQLTADVLVHKGWNGVDGVSDRKFARELYTLGASYKF